MRKYKVDIIYLPEKRRESRIIDAESVVEIAGIMEAERAKTSLKLIWAAKPID